MKNNIFIITAAHQYLYIYDAVKKFHDNESNSLVFLNFNNKNEFIMLEKILLDISWNNIIEIPLYKHKSLIYRYFQYKQLIMQLKKINIDHLYISQYGTSYSYLILNSIQSSTKLISDDGMALFILSKNRKNNLQKMINNTFKLKLKKILYKVYEPISLTFFTTNNIEVLSQDNILHNDLYYLKKRFLKTKVTDSLLFLGSPFVDKEMMTKEKYIELLTIIFKRYKNDKIIYYPHRAESISLLNLIDKRFKNVEVYKSTGPVEFYFLLKGIPKKVISFYSGAIPNLLKLFKNNIEIDAIKIPIGFFIFDKMFHNANMVYDEYASFKIEKLQIINIEKEKKC